ncbi:hypothetical protein M885DRAFT_588040 [Pelagophyceae sp. CCMP2097]|nr:hypothetical protein M885DRAFT_588040 [Pelagophyceae sp. CCMP2097]
MKRSIALVGCWMVDSLRPGRPRLFKTGLVLRGGGGDDDDDFPASAPGPGWMSDADYDDDDRFYEGDAWPTDESSSDSGDDGDDGDDDETSKAAKAAKRWTARAFEAAKRGRPRLAMEAFERALESTPDDAPYRAALLINAGSFLAFSGAPHKALGPLREAADLAPDDARALHALGNALHQCDAPDDALAVYARALKAAPARDYAPNAPLLNNVATILLQRGDRFNAAAALEQSLKIEPRAPGTLFNLASTKFAAALDADAKGRARGFGPQTVTVSSTRVDLGIEVEMSAPHDAPHDANALLEIIALLDRAEPHAPPGSPLRERVLALRGVAAARVPGREAQALRDLRDVVDHGLEHRMDPRRRAAAWCDVAGVCAALDDDSAALQALRTALAALDEPPRSDVEPPERSAAAGAAAGRARGAPPSCSRALAARGDGRDALRARATWLTAKALARRGDHAGALRAYASAAELGCGGSRALLDAAEAPQLRASAPRKFDRAVKALCRNDAGAAIDAFLRALKQAANAEKR